MEDKMKFPRVGIKVKRVRTDGKIPIYATVHAAGADIYAANPEPVLVMPGERRLIETGLCFEVPVGYEVQFRPRSGLALKHGITVLNSPGTIDADYRGELGIILINHGSEPFPVVNGETIAQMVLAACVQADFDVVDELSDTERGSGGFGHTGRG